MSQKAAEVILADAGDYMQGTTYVSLDLGEKAVSMMNLTGYNVATIGNHEFDYGYENLIEQLKNAVVTDNFCASGGDTYYAFARASSKYDTGFATDEIFMRYIADELGGTIGSQYAEPQGRIKIKTSAISKIKTFIEKVINWFKNVWLKIKEFFKAIPHI